MHGTDTTEILSDIPDKQDLAKVSDLLCQLGDPSRLRLFWILCHCEECVINLSAIMEMSSPAVLHHLKRLRAIGLIQNRRSGKEMYYRAADTEEVHLLHDMVEKILSMSCPSPNDQKGNNRI